MPESIAAIFDGEVFHPIEPIALPPNTHVKIRIETISDDDKPQSSFLQVARSLELNGPSDWASHLDDYLYGRDSAT